MSKKIDNGNMIIVGIAIVILLAIIGTIIFQIMNPKETSTKNTVVNSKTTNNTINSDNYIRNDIVDNNAINNTVE